MTGYTVHTGSSQKFAAGWDQVFKGRSKQGAAKSAAGGQASQRTAGQSVRKPARSKRKK